MKTKTIILTTVMSFAFLVCGMRIWAAPTGTAFTYQGRLLDDNLAANGVYDVQFTLYDNPDPLAGNLVGTAIIVEDAELIDGYLTVELDFGNGVFDGQGRWLQVAVRPGGSTGDFTDLSPLQKLTATPYALSAREVTGRVRTPGIYETLSYAWTPRESDRVWICAAMSTDGTFQTAAVVNGFIYISTDSGATWTPKDSNRIWQSVAMSANGSIQTAAAIYGQLYVSTNFGATWTPKESARIWASVAMSDDGTIQTALANTGQIYVSTNTGNTWNPRESDRDWYSVAMSADGTIQTAVVQDGQIYISTDTGTTWVKRESDRSWRCVAMSANGTIQTAAVHNGQIYVSVDAGQTWMPRESNRMWRSVAMSDDGTIQTAVVYNGQIYASTDMGITWQPQESSRQWTAVAMSADGNIQTAGVSYGRLYVASAQTQVSIGAASPSTLLSVSGDALVTGVLNESSDLTVARDDGAEVAIGADIDSSRKLNLFTDFNPFGLYSENAKTTAGVKSAVYGHASGNTTSDSIGLLGRSSSATGSNMGLYAYATTPSSGVNYGIWAEADNSGAGDAYAGYFNGDVRITHLASVGTTVDSSRKLNLFTDSNLYGIYSANATSTASTRIGVYGYASGNTTGDSIGLLGRSSSATGNNMGLYTYATTSSPGVNYGIWAGASNSGAGDAYAGFFNGDVHIDGLASVDGDVEITGGASVEGPCFFNGDVHIAGGASVASNIDVVDNRVMRYRGFPRPDYDSGWVVIGQNKSLTLTHGLGGNVDDYVVDMQFNDSDGSFGVNQLLYGGDDAYDAQRGAHWRELTNSKIVIARAPDDMCANQIRIRIWMYD